MEISQLESAYSSKYVCDCGCGPEDHIFGGGCKHCKACERYSQVQRKRRDGQVEGVKKQVKKLKGG